MIKGKIDFAPKLWASSVTILTVANRITLKTANLIQIELLLEKDYQQYVINGSI